MNSPTDDAEAPDEQPVEASREHLRARDPSQEPVKVRVGHGVRTETEVRADTYEREDMTLRPSNTEEMEIEIRDRSVDRPRIGARVRDGAGQPAMARDRFSGNPPFPLAGQAEVEDQGGIESEEDQRGRSPVANIPGAPLRVTLRHSDGGQYEIWIRNRCIQSFCGEFARVTRCPELDMGQEMQVRIHVVPQGEPRAIPQPQMQIEADRDEAPPLRPPDREEAFGEASMSLALARVRDAFAGVERQIRDAATMPSPTTTEQRIQRILDESMREPADDGVDDGVELHVRQHPTREDQLDAQVRYHEERLNDLVNTTANTRELASDVRSLDGSIDNLQDSLSRRINNLQESTSGTVGDLERRIGNLERLAQRLQGGSDA